MSARTGTEVRCDRAECGESVWEETEELARDHAVAMRWTQSDDGRDFCRHCTEIRASRKSVGELVPDNVRLFEVFAAAEAIGWLREDGEAEGEAHFYCCGHEVEVSSLIGWPYKAHCNTCQKAIADVMGPSFGNGSVAMPDPDKVDTEDPCSWVIVSEYEECAA